MVTTADIARASTASPRRRSPPRAVSRMAVSTSGSRSASRAPLGPEKSPSLERRACRPRRHRSSCSPGLRPAARSIAASSRTTVVFPLEPVTSAMGTSWTRSQSTVAGSGTAFSGQTSRSAPGPDRDLLLAAQEDQSAGPCGASGAATSRGIPLLGYRLPDGGNVGVVIARGPLTQRRRGRFPGQLVQLGGGVEPVHRRRESQAHSAGEAPGGEPLLGPADVAKQAPRGALPGGDRLVGVGLIEARCRGPRRAVEQQAWARSGGGNRERSMRWDASPVSRPLLPGDADAARVPHELAAVVLQHRRHGGQDRLRAGHPLSAPRRRRRPRAGTGSPASSSG